MSTRNGGVSKPPFDSMNLRPPELGGTPGEVDDPAAIAENQRRFVEAIEARPFWLRQVHGNRVVRIGPDSEPFPEADASVTTETGIACTVLVADCLPVLFAAPDGSAVGAAHAGWRGLAAGVLENTVAALCEAAACPPDDVAVWMGACIGPNAFEVGADVHEAFGGGPEFIPRRRPDGQMRWRADLPALARRRLGAAGVRGRIAGGGRCTVEEAGSFFSYRRDGITGRMAAAVWRRA